MRKSAALFHIPILLAVALFTASGCAHKNSPSPPATLATQQTAPPPVSRQTAPPVKSTGSLLFREVAKEAGLDYRWQIPGKRPLTILQTIGNGCAFLDYDNDGNLDILLVGPKLALYKGDGHGHFSDVTQATGLDKLSGHFLGCAVGDYDNDGFDDLYISGWRTGLLLHNEAGVGSQASGVQGDASPLPNARIFRDVTKEAGLKPQPWGTSCGFADLDRDGFLDLYVANYVVFGPDTDPQLCPYHGLLTSCGPNDYDPLQGVLYHNEGGGRFRDVTRAWKVRGHGKGLGIAFADYEGSGYVSLAVANDLVEGDLFLNRGNRRLKNVGSTAGVDLDEAGDTHAGMGIDWADYDNDGRFDLFVTTFANETKCLYRNEGYGLFRIVSDQIGITQPALPYVAWGCKFFDADNDGWLDLLIANGHVQDNISRFEKATYRQPLLFLHSKGGMPTVFEDATKKAKVSALPRIVGRGLAVGDYDNDGRVDALVVDSEGRPLLLHNESQASSEGWIGFRLIGRPRSNRDGYGAVITLRVGGERRVRQCHPGGSYLSSSDPRVHFGLGSAKLESVTIRWPDGTAETWMDLPTGRYLTVKQGERPQ